MLQDRQPLAEEGEVLCRLPVADSLVPFCPVAAGKDADVCLAEGEQVECELRLEVPALAAPVPAGLQVGEAVYLLNGEEAARIPLVTGRAVSRDAAQPQGLLGRLRERLSELSA